jgi:tetratricopeptide (TPR) repeat protein
MEQNFKNKSQEIIKVCDKFGKYIICLLVFFLPLFFSPLTLDFLDFNKQFFLGILVFISLLFWLVKSFFSGRLEFNSNFLNIPILVFILINTLSLVFSSSRYSSFWGWPLNVSQGLLTLIYFFTFYFLVSNYFDKKKEILKLLSILIFSGLLVSLFSILQIFSKFILPWDFTKSISFNTIGTLNSLALFLASLLPIGILLVVISKGLIRWLFLISVIFFLIPLSLINSKLAWMVLIFGNSTLFIFGLLNLKKTGKTNLVFVPMIFLIISLSFLTFSHPINFLENALGFSLPKFLPEIQFPTEISISHDMEFKIIKNSFRNIKNLFLGTGPSTFFFNYLKFKPADINRTPFWNIRFQTGVSEIFDRLLTTGILGIFSLFFVAGAFLWLIIRNLKLFFKKSKKDTKNNLTIEINDSLEEEALVERDEFLNVAIFSSFLAIVLGQFIYPSNLSLLFLFWLVLGISVVLNTKTIKKIKSSFVSAISLTLVFVAGTTLSFSLIKNYQAEIKYLEGLNSQVEGKIEDAISNLKRATDLNPNLDLYSRDISQLYLVRLNEVSQEQKVSREEFMLKSQELATEAVNAAKKATEISSENSLNWINRGLVNKNLISQFLGSKDLISDAIDFYQKAIQLEPLNPQIFTEIGELYIQKSDILRQEKGEDKEINENLIKARENFQKALELKSDFAPANFQMAVVFQREGKITEAIKKLEETKLISPFDPILAYQLGILYYGEGKNNLAKSEFERAVGLDQNYSNARYFLGLIYDKEGNKEKAIEQFEWIERLNPEDQEIKTILKNLREGSPAF